MCACFEKEKSTVCVCVKECVCMSVSVWLRCVRKEPKNYSLKTEDRGREIRGVKEDKTIIEKYCTYSVCMCVCVCMYVYVCVCVCMCV